MYFILLVVWPKPIKSKLYQPRLLTIQWQNLSRAMMQSIFGSFHQLSLCWIGGFKFCSKILDCKNEKIGILLFYIDFIVFV